MLLEGLEAWLVVVALGMRSPGGAGLVSSIGAALAALVLTCLVGTAVRAPLQRVPENTIKFAVGAMGGCFRVVMPVANWSVLPLVNHAYERTITFLHLPARFVPRPPP